MTKINPRPVSIEVPTAEVVGADGQPTSIGSGHFELRLRSVAVRGLRLLIRGMEHTSDELRKRSRHKMWAIEWLLEKVAESYDSIPSKHSKLSEESKPSKSGKS